MNQKNNELTLIQPGKNRLAHEPYHYYLLSKVSILVAK